MLKYLNSSNLKFFIPFLYFIQTRANHKLKIVSWLLTYIIPSFITFSLITNSLSLVLLNLFILMLVAIFCIYECGYIENDVFTILKEDHPTLRLDSNNLLYARQNIKLIYSARILEIIAASFGLIIASPYYYNLISFIICMISLALIFAIYNSIRTPVNLVILPFLVFLRYFSFSYPFLFQHFGNGTMLCYTILMFFVYPIPKLIEHLVIEDKFDTKVQIKIRKIINSRSKIDIFRIYYYITFSILLLLIILTNCFAPELKLVIYAAFFTSLYFLIYRTVSFYYLGLNDKSR